MAFTIMMKGLLELTGFLELRDDFLGLRGGVLMVFKATVSVPPERVVPEGVFDSTSDAR